jgi:hypothetical protein
MYSYFFEFGSFERMLTLVTIFMFLGLVGFIPSSLRRAIAQLLADPEPREKPDARAILGKAIPGEVQSLLDSEGFRFNRTYSLHKTVFGIWMQISLEPPLRYFSVLRHPAGFDYEFITSFSDDVCFRTTTYRSAFVFPHAYGDFVQSFRGIPADSLWSAHLKGEDFLRTQLAIETRACHLPFVQACREHTIRQLNHVRSLPFWYFRAIYWHSVKRYLMRGIPIWKQNIGAVYRKSRA